MDLKHFAENKSIFSFSRSIKSIKYPIQIPLSLLEGNFILSSGTLKA